MNAAARKPQYAPPPAEHLNLFADRAEASVNELAGVEMSITIADYCRIMAPIVALIAAARIEAERGQ